MRKLMLIGIGILSATAAHAQNPDELAQHQTAERKAMAGRQAAIEFKVAMTERVPLEKSVKGVPYSAEIVTEMNQTLADGNRISRRTTGRVYRDGEGRIRREEDRQNGTVAISIVDGVAGASYRLEPETRIAWKTSSEATTAIMKEVEAKRRDEQHRMEAERAQRRPAERFMRGPRRRHYRRRLRLRARRISAMRACSSARQWKGSSSKAGRTRVRFQRGRSATSSRSRSRQKNGVHPISTFW